MKLNPVILSVIFTMSFFIIATPIVVNAQSYDPFIDTVKDVMTPLSDESKAIIEAYVEYRNLYPLDLEINNTATNKVPNPIIPTNHTTETPIIHIPDRNPFLSWNTTGNTIESNSGPPTITCFGPIKIDVIINNVTLSCP